VSAGQGFPPGRWATLPGPRRGRTDRRSCTSAPGPVGNAADEPNVSCKPPVRSHSFEVLPVRSFPDDHEEKISPVFPDPQVTERTEKSSKSFRLDQVAYREEDRLPGRESGVIQCDIFRLGEELILSTPFGTINTFPHGSPWRRSCSSGRRRRRRQPPLSSRV